MKNFFKKNILLLLVLAGFVFPTALFAHPEPIKTPEMYNQKVEIIGMSLIDDNNWFTSADVFFDTEVDALIPPHDAQRVLTETFEMASGESFDFEEPIEIYSHDTCHCDEEFDIDIAVFDYAPYKKMLKGAFWKGLEYLKSYLLGGTTGVTINVLTDLFDLLIEAFTKVGMSPDEAEYQAYVKVIESSDLLGALRYIHESGCEPAEEDFIYPMKWKEEVINGDVTYRITKTKIDKLCALEEEAVDATGDDEGDAPEEPGAVLTPPAFTPDESDSGSEEEVPDNEEDEGEPSGSGSSGSGGEKEPDEDPPVEPDPEPGSEPGPGSGGQTEPEEESDVELPPEEEPADTGSDGGTDTEEDYTEEDYAEEDKPLCLPETGKVLVDGVYKCPYGTYEDAKAGCTCLKGYEWFDPYNLCSGCLPVD